MVIELAEALGLRWCRLTAPTSFSLPTGPWAIEQALKIVFQYWVNCGVPGRPVTSWLLGDAYHGDTVGSLWLGDGGVFSAVMFEQLCFPVTAYPGLRRPRMGGQGLLD